MKKLKLEEAKQKPFTVREGDRVFFIGDDGKEHFGSVRIKEVRCGKKNCRKCPHKIYAYARYRIGKKVTEKYIGVAR